MTLPPLADRVARCAVPVRATGGGVLVVGQPQERTHHFPDFANPLWRPVEMARLEFQVDHMRTHGGPFVPAILGTSVICALAMLLVVLRGRRRPALVAASAPTLALAPVGVGLLGTWYGLTSIEDVVGGSAFCLDRAGIVAIALPDAARPFHLGALCSAVLLAPAFAVAVRSLRGAPPRAWLRLGFPMVVALLLLVDTLALDARRGAIVEMPGRAWRRLDAVQLPVVPDSEESESLPDAPLLFVSAAGVASYDDTHGRDPPSAVPDLIGYGGARDEPTPLLVVDAAAAWSSVMPVLRDLDTRGYRPAAVIRDAAGRPTTLQLPRFAELDPRHHLHGRELLVEIDVAGISIGGPRGVLREGCKELGPGPTVPWRSSRVDLAEVRRCVGSDNGYYVRGFDLWIAPDTRFGDVALALAAIDEHEVLLAGDDVHDWFLARRGEEDLQASTVCFGAPPRLTRPRSQEPRHR